MTEKISRPVETSEGEIRIQNVDDLARNLSLVKSADPPDRKTREYYKILSSGEIVSLIIQTGKYGGTQVIISLKEHLESRRPSKELYLNNDQSIAEEMAALGVKRNESRMFITADLNKGGYEKLYQVLKRRKDDGLCAKLLQSG